MQQDAGFIIADFLYLFQASCAHHQEYKILTWQSLVQVVMVVGGSSLRHIPYTMMHGNTKLKYTALWVHIDILGGGSCFHLQC